MSPATIGFLLGFLLDPPVAVPQASVPSPPVAVAAEAVDYPLGPMAPPDVGAPGRPFKLVDLSYHVSDTDRTTQAFAARVKVRNRGYLGASFEGERREIELVPPAEKRAAATPADPVCPQAVLSGDEGNEEPSAPGISALDTLTGGGHE